MHYSAEQSLEIHVGAIPQIKRTTYKNCKGFQSVKFSIEIFKSEGVNIIYKLLLKEQLS